MINLIQMLFPDSKQSRKMPTQPLVETVLSSELKNHWIKYYLFD